MLPKSHLIEAPWEIDCIHCAHFLWELAKNRCPSTVLALTFMSSSLSGLVKPVSSPLPSGAVPCVPRAEPDAVECSVPALPIPVHPRG